MDVESKIQVMCGEGIFPFGEGVAAIRQWVMEVEVPPNKMRIGEKRKQTLRWYGAIRGAIRMKEIH